MNRLLVHQVEVDLTFSTMVVDSLLVLDESAQIFNVRLQEDLCQGVDRVRFLKVENSHLRKRDGEVEE